ncbi:hypothetical protein [Chamaesiphon sp. VAR_48_metabat_403]|uniref:hypothetical protein n=1 Tax=Chamaesiphon sp. VAR_48_metabat_403 TaxID=2964700 RepID=UPI00286D7CC1|nr:hypothetical protein [Chamaesiphon sp. VAR_48_metabat_403]
MANIKLRDLASIAGADLFNDSESFMQELSENELSLQGGIKDFPMTIRDTTYRFKTPGILPTPPMSELP